MIATGLDREGLTCPAGSALIMAALQRETTMKARPRIDLDGVPLSEKDGDGNVLAIMRYRTTEGLEFLMPESGDFVVPWRFVEEAQVDLAQGRLRIAFSSEWAATENWLRGAHVLVGTWTDRMLRTPTGA